jgi:diadenylate cyclase
MRIEKDKELMNILKLLAPGTQMREGLENVLRAKTGGLIVLNDSEAILNLIDGGFAINADYNPNYIYELAKMDGAIVLSTDLKKILFANTQLNPDPATPTFETGTRHRTADRVAKQTGAIVIAISQRRHVITVYKNNIKYLLRDSSIILGRANQAVQTLEKYVSVLEKVVMNLDVLEFQDLVTLYDVVTAVQRTEMVLRVVWEVERYVCELGNEGRLVSMQMHELVENVERDGIQMLRDYILEGADYSEIYKHLQTITLEELLKLDNVARIMGYGNVPLVDTLVSPRGYRMLSRIPRIPASVIENIVKTFKQLKWVTEASYEELDNVEGIGEARAKAIKNGLKRLREQITIDKLI